jgi:hypothetical protein
MNILITAGKVLGGLVVAGLGLVAAAAGAGFANGAASDFRSPKA